MVGRPIRNSGEPMTTFAKARANSGSDEFGGPDHRPSVTHGDLRAPGARLGLPPGFGAGPVVGAA